MSCLSKQCKGGNGESRTPSAQSLGVRDEFALLTHRERLILLRRNKGENYPITHVDGVVLDS